MTSHRAFLHRLPVRPWTVAVALAAAALTACGGGESDASGSADASAGVSTSAVGGPATSAMGAAPTARAQAARRAQAAPAAPAPRYLVVSTALDSAAVAADATVLKLVDPGAAQPVKASFSVRNSRRGASFAFTTAYRFDAAASTTTGKAPGGERLSQALAVFIDGGRVMKVSARADASAVAQRVSNVSTACAIVHDFDAIDAAGTDAFYQVLLRGTAADCNGANGATVLVRTTMGEKTAPLTLPAGYAVVDLLQTRTDTLDALLVSEPGPRLALYRPDGTRITAVKGSEGAVAPMLLAQMGGPVAFYAAGGQVRRLDWRADGASWSQSLFSAVPEVMANDAAQFVFASGAKLWALDIAPGAPRALATLPAAVTDIALGATRLAAVTDDQAGHTGLYGLPRSGGTASRLDAGGRAPAILGRDGDTAYFTTAVDESDDDLVGVQRVAMAGGGAPAVLMAGAQAPQPLFDAALDAGARHRITGFVACLPEAGSNACSAGQLMQQDAASGVRSRLGAVAAASRVELVADSGLYAGRPLVFTTYNDSSMRDTFVASAGGAGSLRRVTQNIH